MVFPFRTMLLGGVALGVLCGIIGFGLNPIAWIMSALIGAIVT